MKGDIVLAHELHVFGLVGALVASPEALPVIAGRLGPFLRRGDVADRRIEPDIEDLGLETGAGDPVFIRHLHTPAEIARDGARDESLIQPFVGDRDSKLGPVPAFLSDPAADRFLHLLLPEIEMGGVAQFDIAAAGYGGIGVFEICRVQQAAAIVTLVTARLFVSAMRASPLDIAVRQEAAILDGIDLLCCPLLDQAVRFEPDGEMPGEPVVRRARGASEPVIGEAETLPCPALDLILLVAILLHALARCLRRQLRRGAVLIGRADVNDLMAEQPHDTGIHIRRQHRTGEIAEMLHAIDVWQGRSDEDTTGLGHDEGRVLRRPP